MTYLGLIGGPVFIVLGVLLVLIGVSILGDAFVAAVKWLLR